VERDDVRVDPSITARACFPEPACDWFMVTSLTVFAFQYLPKAEL
jgi:hypothetical protein